MVNWRRRTSRRTCNSTEDENPSATRFGRRVRVEHHDGARPGAVAQTGNLGRSLPFDDVLRGRKGRVDPPPPRASGRGQFEVQRLPVPVQDQVEDELLFSDFPPERDGVRPIAPIGLADLHPVPRLFRSGNQFGQADPLLLVRHVTQ